MQQYDPYTVQRMLELLPEIEKRKRRAKKSRGEQGYFAAMQTRPTAGNYTPAQQGGFFPTVQQYRTDYEKIGNQIAGGIGEFLTGRKADREEEELTNMQQAESLKTLEQIGSDPEGGATNEALRGYLGMIGGKDTTSALGKAPHVSSTRINQDGSVINYMSDGTVMDTGQKGDFASQMVQDPITGKWSAIGKSGAGRGIAAPVMSAPGEPPIQPDANGRIMSDDGTTNAVFDGLTPGENKRLANSIADLQQSGASEDQINQFIQGWMKNRKPPTPGQNADSANAPLTGYLGGQPQQFGTATPAQQAAATEQAKIGVQLANAPQTNAAAAQGEQMKLDEKTAAEARAKIPQMQSNLATMENLVNHILAPENDAALRNITGRTIGGNIPDTSFDVDGKSHIGMARRAWDIANSGKPEARLMAMHDQLKGQVFMQAFQMLRGGGQITNVEGEKATAAYARMNRSVSTEDYKAALKDFMDATRAGYAKIQAAASGGYSAGGPAIGTPPAKPALPPGFSWEP